MKNSSASTKTKVVSYRWSSILIGQTIFPTSEYNPLTNQRPHTIAHHKWEKRIDFSRHNSCKPLQFELFVCSQVSPFLHCVHILILLLNMLTFKNIVKNKFMFLLLRCLYAPCRGEELEGMFVPSLVKKKKVYHSTHIINYFMAGSLVRLLFTHCHESHFVNKNRTNSPTTM